MELFLTLLSGICWTIVYIELIRRGFRDKTCGMPLFALALNIAWEILYTYQDFSAPPVTVQGWVNLGWALFDVAILFTYTRYGRAGFAHYGIEKHFISGSLLIFAMAFVLQYEFLVEFKIMAPGYSAFLQNLIMSILFIHMLLQRKNTAGQSLLMAVCKWIGTLAPTILIGILYGYHFILILGLFCSVFDLLYIYYLNDCLKQTASKGQKNIPSSFHA